MCGAEHGVLWGAVAHSTVCAVGRCVSECGVGEGNVWGRALCVLWGGVCWSAVWVRAVCGAERGVPWGAVGRGAEARCGAPCRCWREWR